MEAFWDYSVWGFFNIFAILLLSLLVVSRMRIRKWKKLGIYDYERNCMLLPHEVEERDRRLAEEKAAAERARKAAETDTAE